MHSRRPLVLVVHDDPKARLAQANGLTRAGYRCIVAGDAETALWYASRFALESITLDVASGRPGLELARHLQRVAPAPGIVLVSPVALPMTELPDNIVCLLTPAPDAAVVEAVERASRLRFARPARPEPAPRQSAIAPVVPITRLQATGTLACS